MGKIKKLIPLITIETAVILMLFNQYIFILDVTKYTNNFISGFFDLAFGYLYIIKYIAALIIMYLIVRDKKGIVSGYIGMAYVLLSGLFLIFNFFNYYDYETPLLEQFFIYLDPFIIYIAFAIVFICFIIEKGNKYFLFGLTLAVTIADMAVGSVYYLGHVTYSNIDGIYNSFETFLLEILNTDFYFHWCLCCFIFSVETILILIFSIPLRKKESEEKNELKEKNETIKFTTILITVLVSFLLSFLTIILVLRPLIKICDYNNYENSFVHKTIEKIPQFADSLEKVSPIKIKSKCPFETTDDAEWVFYPKDNIIGLVAIAKEYGDRDNTIILAFRYLKSAESISDTIIHYEYQGCRARYGNFTFDNPEISEEKQFYYVKLVYDNRIVDPQTISFDSGEERVNIDISDENIELSYCYFGRKNIRVKYQDYDAATGMWGEVTTDESNREPESGIPHSRWEELQVVDDRPYIYPEGTNMYVDRYDYHGNYYNIYGEIDTPQVTQLIFSIRYYGVIEGDERIYDDVNEDELNIKDGDVKLYIKKNGLYTDITPEDAEVELYSADELGVDYTFKSSRLGELTEGDYKLEYGGYTDEFTLAVQTFEVW